MGLIVTREAFRGLRDSLDETSRIAFTNGCFDLLHVGHMSLLNFARSLGDALVVGINSDESVRQLKGEGRPLLAASQRARMMASLPAVSFVIIFSEPDPVETIRAVRPHFHVKGGDYSKEDMVETETVERLGGEVIITPYLSGSSTTQLIDLVRSRISDQ
jgi:rfaE bifunctional protein nucleotidyltransferase chain/domain